MEELEHFRLIRAGLAKDLPEVIVINLEEAKRREELDHGTSYLKIQKKMT